MLHSHWQPSKREQKVEREIERFITGLLILSFAIMFFLLIGSIAFELFGEISFNSIGLTVFGILMIFITSYCIGRWIVK